MYRLYRVIAALSILIRNFYLPNPFEKFENGIFINWIMEPFIHIITFMVVGLFYKRASAPALGSLLYLFFYAVHVGLLFICSLFSFTQFSISIIIVLYIVILIGLANLKNKLFSRYYL